MAAVIALGLCLPTAGQVTARSGEQSLKLYNIHTKERAEIVFRRNGQYDKAGLRKINAFLRDWREDEPTTMDPALLDLVWDVYRRSGSDDYIHVVSAYRSPKTNGMLRRRSSGVAKNSIHMKGKALDFYLPDVKLSKLRELGLKLHWGGIGYYPTAGAPFVHMDTGSVRHWPRMTRDQLVRIFPDGKTMHVPEDGKPLAGYALAKAESEARRSGKPVAVAAATAAAPMVIAAAAEEEDEDVGFDPVPTPRLAPRRPAPNVIAPEAPISVARASLAAPPRIVRAVAPAIEPPPAEPARAVASAAKPTIASLVAEAFDFGQPTDWDAPAVPANLAAAMADRDRGRNSVSLPIPPTSVVATIDVTRPIRADLMTSAVLRGGNEPAVAPPLLGYAAVDEPPRRPAPLDLTITAGVDPTPLPRLDPRRFAAVPPATGQRSVARAKLFTAPPLTFTMLDTYALRSWIGPGSTRQRGFAMLTMPDISGVEDLTAPPQFGYAGGFSDQPYPNLTNARFSGPQAGEPSIVMLVAR